jgi:putative spermidine/putrescine transport system permease protein
MGRITMAIHRGDAVAARRGSGYRRHLRWLLIVPLAVFFVLFFVIPVGLLFATSFNPPAVGQVTLSGELTFDNYLRFFSRTNYLLAAGRSVLLAGLVSVVTLIVAWPMAFVIARTRHPARNTALLILVLAAMQLDMVIRLYGMMVILGDNGLINQMLAALGLIQPDRPVRLMYNFLGVVLGLVQFSLPFMILTLVGVIRGIDPSLEEAARSLGANRRRTLLRVTLPASMPGILSGSLLVFALSISSYIVPALMGGFRVGVLPIHIFQQVAEGARFQFGATIAVILFVLSAVAVMIYLRLGARRSGGLA